MRPRPHHLLAFFLVLSSSAACGPGGGTATTLAPSETTAAEEENVAETETSVVITITGLSFPAEVTVPAGKTVTWVNDSSAPHQVQMETHDGAPVDVEPLGLGTDQEGEITLEAGTWAYFCTIHSSMTGSLVVEA